MINRIRSLLCLLSWLSLSVAANPVSWDQQDQSWLSQQSEHFSIHFSDGQQQTASKALDIAERVHQELLPFFEKAPQQRTEIVLVDDFDYSNGWATPLPFAQIRLFMSPPEDVNSLEANDDWLHMLIRHEYAHVLHTELGAGAVKVLRNIFGRHLLLFPHSLTPSMLLEGLAVYLETNKELGYGRLQGNYFDMQMRMQVASGDLKDLEQVVVSSRELPLNANYLYGAYFIEYLSVTYGKEKLRQFLQSYSRKLVPYFLLNKTARRVFGKDFLGLWDDYKRYLTNKFQPEISALKQQAVVGKDLQQAPFLQVTTTGNEGLLVYRNNGDDRPAISFWNNNDWITLSSGKNITAMTQHAQHGLAVSRLMSNADGRQFNDIFLYHEGNWTRLTKQQRFRKMRWMPDGSQLVASRKIYGNSELWLVNTAADNQSTPLWQGETDVVLGAFDIAPSGDFLVASIKRPQQGWNLERFDLTTKAWQPLTDTKATENAPVFLPDGRIVFSADYEGIYNIYVLDINSGITEQWTREIGGAFEPLWQPELGLVYQAYDNEGYTLRYIPNPEPLKEFAIGSVQGRHDYPPAINRIAEKSEPEPYTPWPTLRPRNWLPVFQADNTRTLAGFSTTGSDALGRHNYQLTAVWDFDNSLAEVNALYQYDNRWLVSLQRSHNFNNLLQGEQEGYQITRDDNALLQRNHIYTALEDELRLHAGVIWEKESLVSQPGFANQLAFNETNEALAGLALTYDNRETYLNVPGIGWGHYLDLVAETNEVFNSDFKGEQYQTQWQGTWDLPGRTTLTARLGIGYADEKAKGFKLGGSDKTGEAQLFGRDSQALRGYSDSVQRGHRYATQRLALKTWLGRIERNWSLYPVGLGDISGSLFVDSGAAWDKGQNAKQLTGIGTEVTLEAKLGYQLITLPLTFGYAKGLDSDTGTDQFYVRLNASF